MRAPFHLFEDILKFIKYLVQPVAFKGIFSIME